MTIASVTRLPAAREVSAPGAAAEEDVTPWVLPPGAVPVDCITFGKVVRDVERLTRQLQETKQQLHETQRKLDRLTAEVSDR